MCVVLTETWGRTMQRSASLLELPNPFREDPARKRRATERRKRGGGEEEEEERRRGEENERRRWENYRKYISEQNVKVKPF